MICLNYYPGRLEKMKLLCLFVSGMVMLNSCHGDTPGRRSDSNETGTSSIGETPIPFPPKNYVCYMTREPVIIDGVLDESCWNKTPWTDTFVDIEGDLKPDPELDTRAKMLWDREYLYFAAEMQEPEVWATLRQRDTVIYYDNDFEIFIDPDGDSHLYYEVEINAYSTIWDLLLVKPYRDGGPAVDAWDIKGIKAEVEVVGTINDPENKDEKWTLEVAMPWKILIECSGEKKIPEQGDQWRINFARVEWKLDIVNGQYRKRKDPETGQILPPDNWVWSPQGIVNMHAPETWGFIQFSEKSPDVGTDEFIYNRDEDIKWILRRLYRSQRTFSHRNGYFADHYRALGFESQDFDGLPDHPVFNVSGSSYIISMSGFSEGTVWNINDKGRIWKVKLENVKATGAMSVGLTVYPHCPEEYFLPGTQSCY